MKIKICVGTSCHLMGAPSIIEAYDNYEKDIKDKITLEYSTCFSACQGLYSSPVVKINEEFFGNMTPESFRKTIISKLEKGE